MIKTAQYLAICLYWYCREVARLAAYMLALLAVMFIIHKLVSWALWVMSL